MDYRQQRMFTPADVKESKGKTADALAFSREGRLSILERFRGQLPASVMKADRRTRKSADLAVGSYEASGYIQDPKNRMEEAFAISGRGAARGALSAFPQNIARVVIQFYSQERDVIVDPFAGHNSRMEACAQEGRSYIGYDISEKFMQFNRERRKLIIEKAIAEPVEIELHLQDSRNMKHTADETGDFTLTSPPYWDIEFYGEEPEQLGLTKTYQSFLDDLQLVMNENFRCLKRKAFAVWFVNDFRKNKIFHPYHVDTMRLALASGFKMHDIMVVDFGNTMRAAFANQIIETRILPKRHEYGLVFRKP